MRELLLVLYYPTVATSHSLSITKCTLVNVSASKVVQRTLPKCLLTRRQALAATIHSALTYSKLHFIRPKSRRLPYALADRQPGNQADRQTDRQQEASRKYTDAQARCRQSLPRRSDQAAESQDAHV